MSSSRPPDRSPKGNLRLVKTQANGNSSSPSSQTSPPTSNGSSETSQTSEQPEPWRPQSDNMVVNPEQIPAFMVEAAKLFQHALASEVSLLNDMMMSIIVQDENVDGIIHDPRDRAIWRELQDNLAMLTLADLVARQIQVKYAEVVKTSRPQLWVPEPGMTIPVRKPE